MNMMNTQLLFMLQEYQEDRLLFKIRLDRKHHYFTRH
jgi:hypothetical protein